jgi:hypothetical protein
MSDPEVQIGLMKLLASKHFPLRAPRRKVNMVQLTKAMAKIGNPVDVTALFDNMVELKGRGYVNTIPKIIMRDEIETAEFEVWLTPLGRTELLKKLA